MPLSPKTKTATLTPLPMVVDNADRLREILSRLDQITGELGTVHVGNSVKAKYYEIVQRAALVRQREALDAVVTLCETGHSAFAVCLLRPAYEELLWLEFLRGGLTVGDVYLQGDLIFGPAMVRAYELENSYAIFPRIVVDPAVITAYAEEPAMQGDDNDPDEDVGYLTTLLREGDDQIPFVDYLTGLQDVLDEPDEYISMLRQHRSRLVAAANALSGFNNAKQKYLWLASYHNAVCTGLPENVGDVGPLIELDELGSLSTS